MRNVSEATILRVVGPLVVLALCVVVAPRNASAKLSHETLWGDSGSTTCVNHVELERNGYVSLMSRTTVRSETSEEAPVTRSTRSKASRAVGCLDDSDGSNKSNNLCFEKAGVPASVVPQLLAKARALEETKRVVEAARALVDGESATNEVVASREGPVGTIPPSQPNPENSCTAHPDNCRSLPPLPPTLTVEAPAIAPNVTDSDYEFPADSEPDDVSIPERLRVRPEDGFSSPPFKPPRRA